MALDITEARDALKTIFTGAKGSFEKGPIVVRNRPTPPWMFVASVDLTPGRNCSEEKGGACSNVSWNDTTWYVIGFELLAVHRFNYSFTSAGEGVKAHFTARAVARIPGTKKWMVVEKHGSVNSNYRVVGPKGIQIRKIDSLVGIRLTLSEREHADCRKLGFVPKRSKLGLMLNGRNQIPVPGKGKAYCTMLWRKHCASKKFAKLHPVNCRRVGKPSKLLGIAW